MMIVSDSNAVKNLKFLIDYVNHDGETVKITTDEHNAVLMSEKEYRGIMETFYLQESSVNAQHIVQSIAEAESGKMNRVTEF